MNTHTHKALKAQSKISLIQRAMVKEPIKVPSQTAAQFDTLTHTHTQKIGLRLYVRRPKAWKGGGIVGFPLVLLELCTPFKCYFPGEETPLNLYMFFYLFIYLFYQI